MDYPDVPLTMYRVSFDMVRRNSNGYKKVFTFTFPAESADMARKAVADFCWGINEASAHLYVVPQDQYVNVEELMWHE